MINRRDLLIGGTLLAGAGAAFALTPRTRLNLLGNTKLETAIPTSFGGWRELKSQGIVLPKPTEGSLADRLYDQTVNRLYESDSDVPVMLVIAYGSTQSDQLQLHRPETCYTAIGFEISNSRRVDISLGSGTLPARALLATTEERREPVLYWTRIGDRLPTNGSEQRSMKLENEFAGLIADGVLVRMSTIVPEGVDAIAGLQRFARALIGAVPPAVRPALIGRPLTREIGTLSLRSGRAGA
jgi:EpsI family protein